MLESIGSFTSTQPGMAKHSCPFSISWVGLKGVFIPAGQQRDEGLKFLKVFNANQDW